MAFADAYLLKAGLRAPLVQADPHPRLHVIVTIPVYNESGLERCLDSLFSAASQLESGSQLETDSQLETGSQLESLSPPGSDAEIHAEILILINAASGAPAAVLEQNLATFDAARSWITSHPHPQLNFHVLLDHGFGKKEAGVGVARKVLMDEAARRFSLLDRPDGVIASLDADALVDPDYFSGLLAHFSEPGVEGCSICFEHPLEPDELPPSHETLPPAVFDAIAQYELHLRYYVQAVRSTGYPHAYHTVGSAFAVRAGVYVLEGGMNRRQGGEDFYFIQKVAQRGRWSQCNATRVLPSPRPSDRVPFGTGPVVKKLTAESGLLRTYHPEPFAMLRLLFQHVDQLFDPSSRSEIWATLSSILQDFLETQDFDSALDEIRSNSASLQAFRKRFWRWFNMFRIMKFLHFAREQGYPDMEAGLAAPSFIPSIEEDSGPAQQDLGPVQKDPEPVRQLLLRYRRLQQER